MKLDRTDEILRHKLHDAEFVQGVPSWDEFQPRMNRRGVVRKFLLYASSAAAAAVALVLWLTSSNDQLFDPQPVELITAQKIEKTPSDEALLEQTVPEKSPLAYSVPNDHRVNVIDESVRYKPVAQTNPTNPTNQTTIQNNHTEEAPANTVESSQEPPKHSTSRATGIYQPETAKHTRKRSRTLIAMTPFVSVGAAVSGSSALPDRMMSSAIVNNMLYVQMGQYKQIVDFSQSDYTHNLPLSFGLEFDFALNDRFSVGSGIVYSYLKSTALVEEQFTYKHTQQMHYLGIPANISYKIAEGRRVDVYAKIGAMAEISIASSAQTDIYRNEKFLSSEAVHVSAEGLQMSVNLGVGLNVHLSPKVGIYVEPGLSHYFKNSNHPTSYYSNSQPQFNLRAGLKFQF